MTQHLQAAPKDAHASNPLKHLLLPMKPARARLQSSIKEGREWIINQATVEAVKGCSSIVLALCSTTDAEGKKPVVYFKEGVHSAKIERFLGKFAAILGWDDLFRPTKLGSVYVNKIVYEKNARQDRTQMYKELHGGFKETVEGTLFKQYDKSIPVQASSLRRAFVAMYLLGLNDLNNGNAIVASSGKIVLLDYTRCLPHSNKFQIQGEVVRPVHRFVLFNLAQSREPLDKASIEEMKGMVEPVKNLLPQIKELFHSTWSQNKLSDLPDHWMHLDQAYQCFEERVKTLDKVLQTTENSSLVDLMVACYPEYLFVLFISGLIECLKHKVIISEEVYNSVHDAVGWYNIIEICTILTCSFQYDVPKIYRKTLEPGTTIKSLVNWVLNHPEELKFKKSTDEDRVEHFTILRKWLNEHFKPLPEDFKEVPLNTKFLNADRVLSEYITDYFKSCKFGPYKIGSAEDLEALSNRTDRGACSIFRVNETKETYAVYVSKPPVLLYKAN